MNSPPPLISFSDREEFLAVAREGLEPSEVHELTVQLDAGLPPVTSHASLALLFGYTPAFIFAMGKKPRKYYRSFDIRIGSKVRPIATPRIALKIIQKWLASELNSVIDFQSHVHGFVPERSTITAARSHIGARWLVSLDVKNFFGSVTASQVFDIFVWLGYSHSVAHLLTNLTTLSQRLPQGAPTSPVLSNLAFIETDDRLADYASNHGFALSRYADDISISGQQIRVGRIDREIKAILNQHNWRVASAKTRTYSRPGAISCLGLTVGETSVRPRKAHRRRMRQAQFLLNKGVSDIDLERKLLGIVEYCRSIEPV